MGRIFSSFIVGDAEPIPLLLMTVWKMFESILFTSINIILNMAGYLPLHYKYYKI